MNDLSFLDSITGERILIAPLNWGLGHASRCIPIIRKLSKNNAILIGSDGDALQLLIEEFNDISYVKLPAYNINYNSDNLEWGLFKQSPKLFSAISKEMSLVSEIVDRFKISLIISDHRLGCRDKRIRSIIIAHQLQLHSVAQLSSSIATRINRYFINLFNACWIPDYNSPRLSLAGKLSDNVGINTSRYIGPLSRFNKKSGKHVYDIAIILSGPEPRRTELETKLYHHFHQSHLKIKWVRGVSKSSQHRIFSDTEDVIDMATSKELNQLLVQTKLVISRSGYTTIMDLTQLNKKCILIPTPGQPEQEYLARHLKSDHRFNFLEERDLNQLNNRINQLIND